MTAQTPRAAAMRAKRIRDGLRTLTFGTRPAITFGIGDALASGDECTPEDFAEWQVAYQHLRAAQKQIALLTTKWEGLYTERDREYRASLGR